MKRLNWHWPFHVFYNTLACDLAQEWVFGLSSFSPIEWKAYTNTLRLPLVSSDHLGQQGDGQLGRARALHKYTAVHLYVVPCQMRTSTRVLLNGAMSEWGEFPNDCKKAIGRELSIFLLPRQICLHISLHCLRSLLRQRTAIEIFWQAALCFHIHKRCSEGVRERGGEGAGQRGTGQKKGKGMFSENLEKGGWGEEWGERLYCRWKKRRKDNGGDE